MRKKVNGKPLIGGGITPIAQTVRPRHHRTLTNFTGCANNATSPTATAAGESTAATAATESAAESATGESAADHAASGPAAGGARTETGSIKRNKSISAVLRISRFRHGAGGAGEGGALNNSMADIARRAVGHRTGWGAEWKRTERELGGHAYF